MNLLASVQKAQAWWLFSRSEEEASSFAVIKWWELRRVPFNLVVGATGILTCVVTVVVAAIASEKFGEPLGLPDPPIIAIFAVLAYGVGANACFTGGWITEVLVRKIWQQRAGAFGQISFTLGIVFSILLTLAPAVLFTLLLIARLFLK